MFRIRRIHDHVLPADRRAVAAIQEILRAQFPGLREAEIENLPLALTDTSATFRTLLIAAERADGGLLGFALVRHHPRQRFFLLDFLSAAPGRTGSGVGSVLYEATRRAAGLRGVRAIYLECLPDDPALCADPDDLRQNRARLRFYERYGARPIAGTAYERPLSDDDDSPPYLVVDPLGGPPPTRAEARAAAGTILRAKYAWLMADEAVDAVVASFRDDPVRLREPRYAQGEPEPDAPARDAEGIVLVVNDRHEIHHVRERGYVESPARVRAIRRELERTGLFEARPAVRHAERFIHAVHAPDYVAYLKRVCAGLEAERAVYPYVFPVRNNARPPKDLATRAGYYCIDTFTPLTHNAWLAARAAVDCTLTAAQAVLDGRRLAYALVRPPGHHAERGFYGGFCYFNNAAVAAQMLCAHGRVAILDVDYHHGNGQQQIFLHRADVLTVSIHGHPSFAYPYFSGFEEETGEGDGAGFNLNIPLQEKLDGAGYRRALGRALERIRTFAPTFLVVCLGLDTARADPTGTWDLATADFEKNGSMIGALRLPTLVVQEGGYGVRVLGRNAAAFFRGLHAASL